MRKHISLILTFVIFLSTISFDIGVVRASGYGIAHYKALPFNDPLYIPSVAPDQSANGKDFVDKYWVDEKYHVVVYGTEADVDKIIHNEPVGKEFRYLGFDKEGNPLSNPHFPNDANSQKPLAEKTWLFRPWNYDLCEQTIFSRNEKLKAIINHMALPLPDGLGWSPNKSGGEFFEWGNVQSMPTLLKAGSFRMWHKASDGKIWYQTFDIPKLGKKDDTKFTVTTEIVSNDFTIDLTETTVEVSVKVTAKLEDEAVYNDPIDKILYYNREDIKKWDLKIEYKGKEIHVSLVPNGTNTMSKIFTLKLSRGQIVDKEKVTFVGTGRVTLHNEEYYRGSDPDTAQFTVITPPVGEDPIKLPPDLTITAPVKVNVKETYTVKVTPIVPPGESIKSVKLEASVNGAAYQPVTLSSYSASQQYSNIGTINYRATVTLNNNKTATATAVTQVVDERASTATAKIEQPNVAYEGYWVTVKNKNTFTFDGNTYNAQQASGLGIGNSDFEIQDFSQYPLDNDIFQTRNYDSDIGFDIRYLEPGRYKNTVWALPRNGDPMSDTKGIDIMRCPAIIASVDGTKKSNRKMTLDFSRTVVHPNYPLVSAKTSVVIEDTITGEKVTCTNASSPDSTNIKTNALSGNKMDFLVKTNVDKIYKATISVEDTRGNSDTRTITFTVVPDKAPIAKISAKEQELRNLSLSNKAEIFLQDDSYSEDGDYVTRTWEVAIDTNNNGLFTDETYRAVSLLEGYQDLSGDGSQKKVRFLKTGVGKLDARVKIKEVFGQPTIETFVTAADRKEAVATKTVEVTNVAPVVDFKLFSNIPTTINLVTGSLSPDLQASVQNSIALMQSMLLSNKITPTINFIPQTMDTSKPVWNQAGGDSQNTGRSQFKGVLNSNIKWHYTTDISGGEDLCPRTSIRITPDGGILFMVPDKYNVRLMDKNGTLLKNLQTKDYSEDCVIFLDGRIVFFYGNPHSFDVFDKNLNFMTTIYLPLEKISNFVIGSDNRLYTVLHQYNGGTGNMDYYLYVLNADLSLHTYAYIGSGPQNYGSAQSILVDNSGNVYLVIGRDILKVDRYGNLVWRNINHQGLTKEPAPKVFDETEQMFYGGFNNDSKRYLVKIDATTGKALHEQRLTDFESIGDISIYGDYLYVSDYYRIKVIRKSDLSVATDISQYGYVAGPGANKAVISADGQVFSTSREEDSAFLNQYGQFTKALYNLDGYTGANTVVLSSGAFGSDNTLYLVGAYVTGTNRWGQALCNSNIFVVALGTGGTEQRVDNTLRKLRDYIPADGKRDFTVSITDAAFQDNSETDIANTANLLKTYNDNFFMIGNGSSLPDGQRILNYGTGGNLYWIDSSMWNPLYNITDYIINTIAPTPAQRSYEYYYDKGEIVNYDSFYSDYELDPSQYSLWRYVHTPYTDGYFPQNGQWLSSPVTQFWQNGTYLVQHIQADSTGVPAYDKQSNIAEMIIHIGDGIVPEPPTGHTPEGNIELDGSLKQNRKLTLKLAYANNNAYPLGGVYWTITPLSGMGAADIRYTALTGQIIDTLYKLPGGVRATAQFHDSAGYWNTITRDFYINPDLAPTATLQVTPVTYRNGNGVANINVKATVSSTDDYIDNLKYYVTYDADNNGNYANDTRIYLPQYDNLREFTVDVATGVGMYIIQLDVREGFQEPTIPAFISEADYLGVSVQGTSIVDNIAPTYDARPEKSICLVGEEIRFKSFDGSYLNGDATKGFFDTENDSMASLNVKYIQNKAIMPSQDGTSVYHNQIRTDLVNSLDRAGEYTIEINAYDDPKDGDARFISFNKPSNTCTNKITVHRRPIAALSFIASHDTAPIFDFGNHMYLDGTHLKITDASLDPDGFNLTSRISYKADSGDYIPLNSGDAISLFYGSVFTIKVVAKDNWGAEDTAIYTIMVVNGMDMAPEVIPSPVAASENVALRLTTNQYATSARTVVFGQNIVLSLKSQTGSQKIWEALFNIPSSRMDASYTAQFYAVSEENVELRKDKGFVVRTPINLVPGMPAEAITNMAIVIKATTSKYANSTTVQLYVGTAYQTSVLSMAGVLNGTSKNWTLNYTVPAGIPVGSYTARFTSTTPNGNTETRDVTFRVESLKITGVSISGYWNHWRGQVDLFGKQMSIEPHRFLSLETVKINVDTSGYADRVDIRFSPELEAMQFTDQEGHHYDYFQDYGLRYVYFPASINLDSSLQVNHVHWEYTLPLAPSSVGWDDIRRKSQYSMTITAWKGDYSVTYTINDIDITGNIYDLTYIQPLN